MSSQQWETSGSTQLASMDWKWLATSLALFPMTPIGDNPRASSLDFALALPLPPVYDSSPWNEVPNHILATSILHAFLFLTRYPPARIHHCHASSGVAVGRASNRRVALRAATCRFRSSASPATAYRRAPGPGRPVTCRSRSLRRAESGLAQFRTASLCR